MVAAHGGSGEICPGSSRRSESIARVLLSQAMGGVARIKSEQVTVSDDDNNVPSNSGGSCDVEGEPHDVVFSEDLGRKTSEVTPEDGSIEAVPPVHIKLEEPTGAVDTVDSGGCCYAGVNGSSSLSSIELPMVEDPETDPIVSWSEACDGFIVWDYHEFSKILLPKYFKHSNFSSFIRQLNTYGFRKIDSDRWEFANDGFQGGKKHLLKNIRRRKINYLHKLQQGGAFTSMRPGLKIEVEKLKRDQNILKGEILKLRQQQENSQVQLVNVQKRVRSAELKQYHMLFYLTNMARKPTLVQQLIQKIKRKRELDGGEIGKRPRLLGTHYPVSFPKAMDTVQGVDYIQQSASLKSELIGLLSETVNTSGTEPPVPSAMEDEHSHIHGLRGNASRASANHVSSACCIMSEKLMEENFSVDEELDVNDSNIYLELEDLISKPSDWVGSASGLVGQTGCI